MNITKDNIESLDEIDLSILTLHARGFSSAEIGKKLNLSSRTIEGRTLKLTTLFNAKNKTELVCALVDKGVITLQSKK